MIKTKEELKKELCKLCFNFSLTYPHENNNDPIHNLLSKFDEIKNISQNEPNEHFFQFLYFNKKKVHNIFYDEDEIFPIDENNTIIYSELFYLSLLLLDIEETINYSFSIDFIRSINNKITEIKESYKIKKILMSKIVLILIQNFKGENDYNEEEHGNEIESIEKEKEEYIKNNINIFPKKLDIISIKIDIIYREIIVSLIEEDKFGDYNYCLDIINQLELENIYINDNIFKKLSETINDKKEEYIINNTEDLTNEKKINFYFILIKYICKKDTIYISQIDFLYENIRNLSKLIENEEQVLKNEKIEELKILVKESFCFSYKKKETIQQSVLSEGDNNDNNESKDKDENSNEHQNILLQKSETLLNEQFYNNIIEFEKAQKALEKMKIKIQIIPEEKRNKDDEFNFIFKKILIGNDEIELKNIDELKIHADYDSITDYEQLGNKHNVEKGEFEITYKNYKRLASFFKDLENAIKGTEYKFNPQINLLIEREHREINQEEGQHQEHHDNIYNLTCTSTFDNQLSGEEMKFIDKNILVDSFNGKGQGLNYLLNEITNDDYSGENFKYSEKEEDNKDKNNN